MHASDIFQRNRAGAMRPFGLYDPASDRDSCGVGFVVRVDGTAEHAIVQDGIRILVNLEHRGAVGGDKSTGDGAGILIQVPDAFFRKTVQGFRLPPAGDYAPAMVFLPADEHLARRCSGALEDAVRAEGMTVLGWRDVPTNNRTLGELARSTEPRVRQLFIGRGELPRDPFEVKCIVARRRAEKEVASWTGVDASPFYVPSLSPRTLVYKGLINGHQLPEFYPDLMDEQLISPFALVHQRYSTNTLPTWALAQPLRLVGHNGEINTLRGNINRMKGREAMMQSEAFGADIETLKPVIVEGGSDSAIFDNVLELLVAAGRSLPHAVMMMIPEAYGGRTGLSEDKHAFYEFHSSLMEPWDGPAAMAFCDGRYIGATLDRNGLRPARYTVTRDGLIALASETGVLEFPTGQIHTRGKLQPGKMLLVDLKQKRIVPDNEIKAEISRRRPYRRWIKENRLELRGLFMPSQPPHIEPESLFRFQQAFGYTDEDLRLLINPMASRGQEAVGSMGNDVALPVLSARPQLLFAYFKQLFAQVTNPPIDPLREELVMSLESNVGRERNFLDESPEHCRGLRLHHPILTNDDMVRIRGAKNPDLSSRRIDLLFPVNGDPHALPSALDRVFAEAEKAIAEGATILILSDKGVDMHHAPIPSLLATAGLHHHLLRKGFRTSAGIIVETGEPREVMHFALLVGYGADAICPYLAFQTVRSLSESSMLETTVPPEEAIDNYITAVKKGLLKTFSRMGISTVHSFFGAQIFEAVGIGNDVIDRFFCGTPSRIGGIGLDEIAQETVARHRRGFPSGPSTWIRRLLDAGGQYAVRDGGEKHLWTPEAVTLLQTATRLNDYGLYKRFAEVMDDQVMDSTALRGLLRFHPRDTVPIAEVEPVEEILKRFVSAAMSFGSISREAHEAVAEAMNRIGGRSNSGEGGEDPGRYVPRADRGNLRSKVKQVASGRFGVTTEYLVHSDELQIKIAQGAKPGEGGQLPGHKVTEEIARVRHTTPGVTLISPPPHHDIYSIEDLAQLIFDLRSVHPGAKVSVKLVSEIGVGTIASGVAKAKADLVLISGQEGGTGASPLTAIKHAGLPWELGLAETQHALIANRLRDKIRVQVDGQLKTGRDLAIAALLGAEEFGFGTALLITLGCVMVRKCHLNTCPVGVATQDPGLRARFGGKAEYVERFLRFAAQNLREHMAALGFRTLDGMIGRSEVLAFDPPMDHPKARLLDFSAVLGFSIPEGTPRTCTRGPDAQEETDLDREIRERSRPAIEHGTAVAMDLPVRNVHRTIGARISGEIVKRYGPGGLPDGTVRIRLTGSAGQSLGAFLAPGVEIRVQGDANDYVGKGMSGGRIVVMPPPNAGFMPHENVIAGNVVLYGATDGELFLAGTAGERFAVRNSGATAVVEGVGDHGCEYMTGGTVVVIGPTGNNFAAGMSGGIAYVYDPSEHFDTRINFDMVDLESVSGEEDKAQLRGLLEMHVRHTGSPKARTLLEHWEANLPLFVKVIPIDYRKVLERMRQKEGTDQETVAATEEVFHG
jgi:glutamate synthase (NADPH/NADH) large chain/glutamate synthase (ferredoxin)